MVTYYYIFSNNLFIYNLFYLVQRNPKKDSEEVEIAKPKGIMEEMMTSYFNFLKYLIQL